MCVYGCALAITRRPTHHRDAPATHLSTVASRKYRQHQKNLVYARFAALPFEPVAFREIRGFASPSASRCLGGASFCAQGKPSGPIRRSALPWSGTGRLEPAFAAISLRNRLGSPE